MHPTIDQPAALPEPIETHPQAINLYMIVTGSIALGFLLCVIGAILLAIFDIPIPDILNTLGMAALVALAAVLNRERA